MKIRLILIVSSYLSIYSCFAQTSSVDFFASRGNEMYNQQKYNEAINFYSKAISINPRKATYYIDRGNAYYAINLYNEALSDFNIALSLDINYAYAYFDRGLLENDLGQYKAALS